MKLEHEFPVDAPAGAVFAYLLDVNRVVGCVPGAELSEVVDPSTFKGKVKIKVGPVTVAYNGTARIADRDEAARRATLTAEGRETTGPGSARATAVMTVSEDGAASRVRIEADYTVAGRVAQFGRGLMEDVARRLLGQMAACIAENLRAAPVGPEAPLEPAAPEAPAEASGGPVPASPAAAVPARAATTARPVNAFALLFSVLWERIKSLFRRR